MYKSKKLICIIPARSGSVRIKNKNIKLFYGIPIIVRTIKILKSFKLFDKIIVSTDSSKIEKIVLRHKIEVLKRNKTLANAKTSTITVIKNVLTNLRSVKNNDYVFCIYPTSIFVKKKYLILAISMLSKKTSFVFTAKKYDSPIYRAFFLKNKKLNVVFKNKANVNTQKLKETFFDAAQFYLGKKNNWLKEKEIFSERSNFLIYSKFSSQDIDDMDDWNAALKLWKIRRRNSF
jgi:N-acylneuraminate cytidylyltransferase